MEISIFELLDKRDKAIQKNDKETLAKCELALARWKGKIEEVKNESV